MKISKLEWGALALTAVFFAFSAGWLLRGTADAPPVRVETERTLTLEEQTLSLPPQSTPAPEQTLPPGEKLNINTASAAELQRLPGIGEKRAADIIADRTANGPFRIPEDLTRVSGIGEGTLAHLLDYITTGEDAP
ncbi:ComEA family DNA-binding protein [Pseudoflavonifractor sp. 524-17]|uniref:ComEA family DNA-binding protein n=1 Tax=Pseudoflavonifractor sp. 524-17 TaxID=2304577 RepID=UPI00192A2795|nr:ComEA family DNA-binding protein [Pseudoflavonifractor sp. 524-17]